jgi:predicted nucleic acid-binding protein
LCSFLKIGQLSRVREFFGVQDLLVPPAVLYEICLTDLVSQLTAVPGIRIQPPDARKVQALKSEETFSRLGPGEQEAIALSLEKASSVLLMNDSRAGQVAARLGVDVFNVPGFLLGCKFSGSVSRKQIADLVAALEERDHYGFKKDARNLLLS